MKRLTLLFSLVLTVCLTAQVNPHSTRVHSYTKKDGTHVQSYRKTQPNGTKKDNYSHKGNTNPYTGKKGTKK
jgi:hypothetical protein